MSDRDAIGRRFVTLVEYTVQSWRSLSPGVL
jgi:hypothetical protein